MRQLRRTDPIEASGVVDPLRAVKCIESMVSLPDWSGVQTDPGGLVVASITMGIFRVPVRGIDCEMSIQSWKAGV